MDLSQPLVWVAVAAAAVACLLAAFAPSLFSQENSPPVVAEVTASEGSGAAAPAEPP